MPLPLTGELIPGRPGQPRFPSHGTCGRGGHPATESADPGAVLPAATL